jgi:HupE/UreJ protein
LVLFEESHKPVAEADWIAAIPMLLRILNARRGRPGLTARLPWLVAFSFGLLHGFGFAGAGLWLFL